jgi:pilus assembly protein Flp/PilA
MVSLLEQRRHLVVRRYDIVMNTLAWLARRSKNDRLGVTALEYGLLAALIALAIVTAVSTYATDLGTLFTNVGGNL